MSVWAGIDVAKDTLAVAVRPGGECWTVANTPAAHAALCRRLHELGVVRVVLEATGGYERAVLEALAASGLSAVRAGALRPPVASLHAGAPGGGAPAPGERLAGGGGPGGGGVRARPGPDIASRNRTRASWS